MKQLGVNIDATPTQQARCLSECGVCFSFAINHHPAMKHAAGPRRSIGFPSIFNLLGPLTNPAGASRQLMGVYGDDKLELVGEALRRLGAEHAWVVHARDGMDEISTTAPTLVAHVTPETVKIVELSVEKMGIARTTLDALRETTLEGAAERIRRVLSGEVKVGDPGRDIVAINAAAAVLVAGATDTLKRALDAVNEALDAGAGAQTLGDLARLSGEPA
jgi:anthranilate phosphoribosyltransferase